MKLFIDLSATSSFHLGRTGGDMKPLSYSTFRHHSSLPLRNSPLYCCQWERSGRWLLGVIPAVLQQGVGGWGAVYMWAYTVKLLWRCVCWQRRLLVVWSACVNSEWVSVVLITDECSFTNWNVLRYIGRRDPIHPGKRSIACLCLQLHSEIVFIIMCSRSHSFSPLWIPSG